MLFHVFQNHFCLTGIHGFLLQSQNGYDEEFNLFLFTILILGMIFICVSIIISAMIAIICLVIIFGLIGIGALSASVLIGINKKSFTTGFRIFIILFCTFSVGVLGVLCFYILNRIFEWWTTSTAIISGLCFGFISGFAAGILIAYIIKRVSTFLKNKLDRKQVSIS
jgi:hypothetical protein